jgi:hypothetical protein
MAACFHSKASRFRPFLFSAAVPGWPEKQEKLTKLSRGAIFISANFGHEARCGFDEMCAD